MARIDYATTDHLSDRGKTLMDRLSHKNIFRILSHSVAFCRILSYSVAFRLRNLSTFAQKCQILMYDI